MKAILIDPYAIDISHPDRAMINDREPVREVDIGSGFRAIIEALNMVKPDDHPRIRMLTTVNLTQIEQFNDPFDSAFVDDEGLFNMPTHFWKWDDYPQPIAGPALVIGADSEGENTPPSLSVETIAKRVFVGAANIQLHPASGNVVALPDHFARVHDQSRRFG